MKALMRMSLCVFSFLVLVVAVSNIVLFAQNVFAQPDETLPVFGASTADNTLIGQATNFSVYATDNVNLNESAGFIFSTINTGTWENSSYYYFSGVGATLFMSNVTTLNDTVGAVISWRFYANDTSDNWNASGVYNLTTTTTQAFKITVYNGTGEQTGTTIAIYNASNDLIGSGTNEVVTPLNEYNNYTLEINEDVDGTFMTIRLVDLNITDSFTINSQTVPSYTEELPSGYNKVSSVIALDDAGLTYSYATIYIPNDTFTFTKIFHCNGGWNYETGSCNLGNWEVFDIIDYDAKSNESHTFFNVTTFDGYGGGGSVWLEVELILPPGDTFVEGWCCGYRSAGVERCCGLGAASNGFGRHRRRCYGQGIQADDVRFRLVLCYL